GVIVIYYHRVAGHDMLVYRHGFRCRRRAGIEDVHTGHRADKKPLFEREYGFDTPAQGDVLNKLRFIRLMYVKQPQRLVVYRIKMPAKQSKTCHGTALPVTRPREIARCIGKFKPRSAPSSYSPVFGGHGGDDGVFVGYEPRLLGVDEHIRKDIFYPFYQFHVLDITDIKGQQVNIAVGIQDVAVHCDIHVARHGDEIDGFRIRRIAVVHDVDAFLWFVDKQIIAIYIDL